jgi:hypothetical protein
VKARREEGNGFTQKKKPWVHAVEYANFVALAPPNKPSVDNLEEGKKIPIPETFHAAVASEHAEYWKCAMDEEMSSFEANSVFEFMELPESRKPVGGRWIYSIKRNEQGVVSKFKARWVAKGYSQREGIDLTETYAPVSKMATLRTLLTIAADEDLELRQIDFKTAFLTANLIETVYMDQPTGYEQPGLGGKKLVAHLLKAVYGLRQSPLAFYDRSGDFFDTIELQAIEADSCLYVGWKDGRRRLLLQYVDDVVAAGEKADVDEMIEKIKGEFAIRRQGEHGGRDAARDGSQEGPTSPNDSPFPITLLPRHSRALQHDGRQAGEDTDGRKQVTHDRQRAPHAGRTPRSRPKPLPSSRRIAHVPHGLD